MNAKQLNLVLLTLLLAFVTANTNAGEPSGQVSVPLEERPELTLPDGTIREPELRAILRQINDALVEMRSESNRVQSTVDSHLQEYVDFRESANYHSTTLATLELSVSTLLDQMDLFRQSLRAQQSDTGHKFEQLQTTDSNIKAAMQRVDQAIETMGANVIGLEQEVARLNTLLEEQSVHVDRNFQEVAGAVESIEQSVQEKYLSVSYELFARSVIGVCIALVLLLAGGLAARRLNSARRSATEEVSTSISQVREEQNRLDLKLSEFLTQQVLNGNNGESDQSFFLTVADEINRMRKRISRMPSDTKGVKPLEMALERLESGLQTEGYEVVNLLGEQYVEGLSVKPRFIPDDQLEPGEQVITNIVRPQVNYRGKIVQIAEVEVSIGG